MERLSDGSARGLICSRWRRVDGPVSVRCGGQGCVGEWKDEG